MAAFAELDGEVLMPFLDEAMSAVAGVASDCGLDVRRILDVGCGPGVSTCRLAEQFTGATVVAADGSAEMLVNAARRAERLGLDNRIETRRIDLPDGIDTLGAADVVWASMVLHHVGDEAAAVSAFRSLLPAGGLLVLVEFGDPMRVLPDDADGTWARLDAAGEVWMREMRASLPGAVVSDEYPALLAGAGFEVVIDRTVPIHFEAPLDDGPRQLAHRYLERMREHVEPYAEAADLAALDGLIAEDGAGSILRRPDARLHLSRRLFVARGNGG